jgi:hypothetical protein
MTMNSTVFWDAMLCSLVLTSTELHGFTSQKIALFMKNYYSTYEMSNIYR